MARLMRTSLAGCWYAEGRARTVEQSTANVEETCTEERGSKIRAIRSAASPDGVPNNPCKAVLPTNLEKTVPPPSLDAGMCIDGMLQRYISEP